MNTAKLLTPLMIYFTLLVFTYPYHLFAQQDYINADDIGRKLKLSSRGKMPFGYKLGTSKDKIEEKVTQGDIYIKEKDYIIYTIYFNPNKMDFGDVTYDFKDNELSSASFETYFTNEQTYTKVVDQIKEALNKKYDKPRLNGVNYIWTYDGSIRSKRFEVELTNVSTGSDYGFQLDYYTEGLIP